MLHAAKLNFDWKIITGLDAGKNHKATMVYLALLPKDVNEGHHPH